MRAGVVFRLSGGLFREKDLAEFERAKLKRVIDLRGVTEDRSIVQNWTTDHGIDYVSEPIPAAGKKDAVDIARLSDSVDEALEYMQALYIGIVDRNGREIANTIAAMAEELPAGYGCAAGKDRTGIVTAFLHIILGVPEEEAVRRYVDSAPPIEHLGPLARDYFDLEEGAPMSPGMEAFLRPQGEILAATVTHVAGEHGSVAGYLAQHGLGADTVEQLRENLLAPV